MTESDRVLFTKGSSRLAPKSKDASGREVQAYNAILHFHLDFLLSFASHRIITTSPSKRPLDECTPGNLRLKVAEPLDKQSETTLSSTGITLGCAPDFRHFSGPPWIFARYDLCIDCTTLTTLYDIIYTSSHITYLSTPSTQCHPKHPDSTTSHYHSPPLPNCRLDNPHAALLSNETKRSLDQIDTSRPPR